MTVVAASICTPRRPLPPPSSKRAARLAGLLTLAVLAGACSREQAEDKAKELADKAKDESKELADKAGDKAKELGDQAGDKVKREAGKLWAERPDNGELSAGAKDLLSAGAEASGQGAEALIGKGEQLAPVAVDVAKTLATAVDSEHLVEPIIQDLDDEKAQAELDARIQDMPRVETIDGLDVGFKDMTQYDTGGRSTESAYLVLWRRDDKLVGLIYRSKQRIEVDTLIEETPRLIGLVQGAL